MAASGYTAGIFSANEVPTTAMWNLLWTNDASFNTGNGLNDASILARHLASGAVGSSALASGAVTNSAIASGAVSFSSLLSTIFSGQINSYTNTNTAGGTFYYINLGGLKLVFGQTGSCTANAGASPSFTVNFPASFFTSVYACVYSNTVAIASVSGNYTVGNSLATSFFSFYVNNTTASNGVGGYFDVIAIGV